MTSLTLTLTYDSTYSFKCSVAKTRHTLVFKLHLNLLLHSTKTLSVAYNIVHLSYKVSRQITVLKRNEQQCNAAHTK